MRSRIARFALVASVAGIALYGTETWLALTEGDPALAIALERVAGARRAGVDFDERTNLGFLLDARAAGVEVWPSLVPEAMSPPDANGARRPALESGGEPLLPLAGLSRRTILNGNESGRFATFESDEHGFNNPLGLWEGRVDAVVVGDSFVQGFAVDAGEGFVSRLRATLPSVVNLGINGAGPLTELAAVVEYGVPLRPRWIVWCYFEGNDLDDLAGESATAFLRSYLKKGFRQNLIERQAEIDRLLGDALATRFAQAPKATGRARDWPLRSILELQRVRSLVDRPVVAAPPDPGRLEVLRAALERVREEADALDARTLFVYLPDWRRFADEAWAPVAPRADVLELARASGMHVVDVATAFDAHGDPLELFPFRSWGHYVPAGHAVVARAVADALR